VKASTWILRYNIQIVNGLPQLALPTIVEICFGIMPVCGTRPFLVVVMASICRHISLERVPRMVVLCFAAVVGLILYTVLAHQQMLSWLVFDSGAQQAQQQLDQPNNTCANSVRRYDVLDNYVACGQQWFECRALPVSPGVAYSTSSIRGRFPGLVCGWCPARTECWVGEG
jgi:hypothetical protein